MRSRVIPIIFILNLAIVACPAFASQNKLNTIFETGERSVTDTTEDRDLSGNLDFYRYYMRFDHELSKLTNYNFSYEHYYKNYGTADNFDSTVNEWHFGFDHTFEDVKENPLKLNVDVGLKDKNYKSASSSDYVRSNASVGLEYKHENAWALIWKNGLSSYDYTKSDADQIKMFTKLGGWVKLFDERLEISPSYKMQMVDQESPFKNRTEDTAAVSSYYKLNLPYFNKVAGFYETGRNDTKDYEDEDRDDELHFKYTKWRVQTEHPLIEKKLDTAFKYSQIRRNYQDGPNDYMVWALENKTDFKIFEDAAKKINFSLQAEHKESDYQITDSLRYIRNLIGGKFSYQAKNNWELSPAFTFKKYDYSANPLKDERQYELKTEFVKELSSQGLDLRLTYKICRKDLEYQHDVTLWSVKAGVEYRF